MADFDVTDVQAALQRIQAQTRTEHIRLTIHAQQEMLEEKPDEVQYEWMFR